MLQRMELQPTSTAPGSRHLISLLSEADFRRVWIAGGVFGTIRWLEMLSIGVYVFDLTGKKSPLV